MGDGEMDAAKMERMVEAPVEWLVHLMMFLHYFMIREEMVASNTIQLCMLQYNSTIWMISQAIWLQIGEICLLTFCGLLSC